MNALKNFIAREEGQDLVEYALLGALGPQLHAPGAQQQRRGRAVVHSRGGRPPDRAQGEIGNAAAELANWQFSQTGDPETFKVNTNDPLIIGYGNGGTASSRLGSLRFCPMLVRRIATVTICAPEASIASRVYVKSLYLPVPISRREL